MHRRPSLRPPRRQLRPQRSNPVPRVLLILLLFGLPLVLIPPALDVLNPPESASPPDPREELNRVLAAQGVVRSDQPAASSVEEPVEVAGYFVTARAFDAPVVQAASEDALIILEDDEEEEDFDSDDGDLFADVDEA